ncbi:alpha/beta-hydrolase [Atractiella rhizophila]|nr:alpha/beta-hydrolase [Atractiella rhizophila]
MTASDYPRLLPELREWYSQTWSSGYSTKEHPSKNMRAFPVKFSALEETVARGENTYIQGGDGQDLRLWVVRPTGVTATGVTLLSFHAGGGVSLAPELNNGLYSLLAEHGITIVSVDYRLAPEHPLPASPKDAYAAWSFVTSADGAKQLNIDPKRVGLLGSSFGGFLAGGLSQRLAKQEGGINPFIVILDGSMLSDPLNAWKPEQGELAKYYHIWTTANDEDVTHHLDSPEANKQALSPLNTIRSLSKEELSRLPPHFINMGELDSASAGDYEYGRFLLDAGVPTDVRVWRGTVHIFPTFVSRAEVSKRTVRDWVEAIRDIDGQRA